jgi:signal transduction histidine kinase
LHKLSITTAERDILDKISLVINSGNSLEDIIDSIFPDIRKIIPCDRIDIALIEEDGQRIVIRNAKADYSPLQCTPGYATDLSGIFYHEAIVTQTPAVYNLPPEERERYDSELPDLLMAEGISACAVIPVLSRTTLIGALSFSFRDGNPYTERLLLLLEEIARLLRHTLEKTSQSDQIEKHYQAYKEMLGFVAHELKSPLSSIITLTQTLSEGYFGKIDEQQRKILHRIIKKAEYLEAMSTQYLNLSRFEGNMLELRPRLVDFVEDVIEPIIELLLPQIDERSILLERDYENTIFPVLCDPDLLKIVVLNLLSNAIKYGNKKGILRISIKKQFKKFSVSVWNEGPGFSDDEKHRLFKKFSRLAAKELIERKGSGIGLYVSWKIIQLHGGRIFAESEQGSWARFTFELPQHMDFRIAE